MKKNVLFTIAFISIFLWSCVLGTQVKIANANPISEAKFNAPPIIAIQSPLNNETFSFDNVLLVFTVTKPEVDMYGKWIDDSSIYATYHWTDLRNKVINVTIALDGEMYRSIEVNSNLSSSLNFSLNMANLEVGAHTVQIHTLCEGVVLEAHALWNYAISYSTSSDIVYFTITEPFPTTIVATASASAAIVSVGLLIYFKKRK